MNQSMSALHEDCTKLGDKWYFSIKALRRRPMVGVDEEEGQHQGSYL